MQVRLTPDKSAKGKEVGRPEMCCCSMWCQGSNSARKCYLQRDPLRDAALRRPRSDNSPSNAPYVPKQGRPRSEADYPDTAAQTWPEETLGKRRKVYGRGEVVEELCRMSQVVWYSTRGSMTAYEDGDGSLLGDGDIPRAAGCIDHVEVRVLPRPDPMCISMC